jgi:RND family efflux transporter MFP subunit
MKIKLPNITLISSIGLLSLASCSKEKEEIELVRPVRTIRLEEASDIAGRIFPGRAEALLAVDIAFEVSGQLTDRPIQVGDNVNEGQMLAKLDPRDYANRVESAKSRLERATTFLERIKKAVEGGAVSQQQLTDAQAQFDIAGSNLNIELKALADTKIQAPFGGTISAIYVENHSNIESKQAILRLMDLSEIELKIDIPEKLIMLVTQVKDITVTFDAFPNQPVPATVKEIGKEASASTRTFPVTLVMKQPKDFTILPGMTGQATGKGGNGPTEVGVFQVPGSAIIEEAGKQFVWVVNEKSMTVTRKPITPKGSNRLGMLIHGLEKGQLLVTAGVHNLNEGQTIKVHNQ